jgi:hypothetical protein
MRVPAGWERIAPAAFELEPPVIEIRPASALDQPVSVAVISVIFASALPMPTARAVATRAAPPATSVADCTVAGDPAAFFRSGSVGSMTQNSLFLVHGLEVWQVVITGPASLPTNIAADVRAFLGSWQWLP